MSGQSGLLIRTGTNPDLDELLEQLGNRLQAGERLDLEAVVREYPRHADDLRCYFPALRILTGLKHSSEEPAGLGELGDFRILREVGKGGMGIVYEAEQVSLRRRVALKVLPFAATMDPRHLQRFRNEARAAACLHHEHIIPVYFVGCERGVHFYAMQFIDGQTLAQLIQALQPQDGPAEADATQDHRPAGTAPTVPVAALSTERSGPRGRAFYRQAAELIVQAAEALEHAHSLGIVHRDVKPANLLVGPTGKLWVGDFGLARLGADAGLTMSGDLLGTLRYMAPEQALARHGLVDHRADVYALGATLYELLTLRSAVTGTERAEVLRQVAFEEPVAPRKLDKGIPAELETITLKCLAKNPNERYPAASELAEDLRRWLEDRAIKARPPTLRQRAVKWAWRHRSVVGAATVILLLGLLAGGVFAWRELRQQAEAEHQVELALQEATIFQGENKWAEGLVAVRRAEVLLESRGGGDALRRRARDLRRDLDMIANLEDTRLLYRRNESIPGNYAKAFRTYGIDVETLDPQQAGQLVRKQPICRELITALDLWAVERMLRYEQTKDDTIKGNWNQLLRVARLAKADDRQSQVYLAIEREDADALSGLARVDTVMTLPPSTLVLLATALHRLGAKREALDLLRKAQRRHPGDYWVNHVLATRSESPEDQVRFYSAALAVIPQCPYSQARVARAFRARGMLDEAVALYREAVRVGPDYPQFHADLANVLVEKGLLDEAIAEYKEVIRLDKDSVGAHSNLGLALQRKGRLDEAIAEFQEAIRLDINPDSPGSFWYISTDLVASCPNEKFRAGLLALAGKAIERTGGKANGYAARGQLYAALKQSDKAEADFSAAIAAATDEKERIDLYLSRHHLYVASGWTERARQDQAQIIQLLEQWLEKAKAKPSPDHPATLRGMYMLAKAYEGAGKLDQVDRLLRDLLERQQKKDGPKSADTAGVLAGLGLNLLKQQRYAEAEPLLRECLAIREQKLPDDWLRFNAQSLLGGALLGQKKYDAAEPLLVQSYEGMKQREDKIPPLGKRRLPEAVERIVQLYEATQRPEKARAWRAKLPPDKAPARNE
jgi:serine/threonine protein kinase/Flp pilus assembly protein TadD